MTAGPGSAGPEGVPGATTTIAVDPGRCVGHGRCAAVAPEVYDLDDAGYSVLLRDAVAAGLATAARRGAEACPERAIRLDG